MAKKRNPTVLIVFAVMAAVTAGGGWWLMRGGGAAAGKAAQASATAPALPDGVLQYAGQNLTEIHYLDPASVKRSGQSAEVTVLVVGKTADAIAHQYAMVAKRETLDCSGRVIGELAGEYDAAAKLKNTEYLSSSVGRPADSTDFEVAVLCAGKPGPAWRGAKDWRAAQREAQMPPDTIAATAEADLKDADAWASLCRRGARGNWRRKAPKDCDHAVGLRPGDAATRLNRGYMNMAIGHNPAAAADFRAILAKDPDNAGALFGQSLLEGMAKNLAASKRDRDRALALDPRVPDWVTASFRILISDPFDRP